LLSADIHPLSRITKLGWGTQHMIGVLECCILYASVFDYVAWCSAMQLPGGVCERFTPHIPMLLVETYIWLPLSRITKLGWGTQHMIGVLLCCLPVYPRLFCTVFCYAVTTGSSWARDAAAPNVA
jgi:hypothetical protein